MQAVLQILFKIVMSLATEKVIRALLANGLEQVVNHTDSPVDNTMVEPIIKALRGE